MKVGMSLIERLTLLYAQLGTVTKSYDAEAVADAIDTIEAQQAQIAELREAGQKAIETLAASRHLIGKYTPYHHWLPEHDERIADLKAALNHMPKEEGNANESV